MIGSARERNGLVGDMMMKAAKTRRVSPIEILVTIGLTVLWSLCDSAVCGQAKSATATVTGHVQVQDSNGASYVPGALVVLKGADELTIEADANGEYRFASVRSGVYVVEATAPGLQGEQSVTVSDGEQLELPLTVHLVAAASSVTVTDTSDGPDIVTTSQTIKQETITDAPNADQKFETLLPLVPGVVRGADGHINLKGARNTQSGSLVNSANVTDPASGTSAINLPIDVVSSVQVVSNPFDPQFGRFTGAIATVETKTGSYDKMHFSLQNVVPRWRDRGGTIAGIGAATPRVTVTGPIVANRAAITQSFEYRFVRTPV